MSESISLNSFLEWCRMAMAASSESIEKLQDAEKSREAFLKMSWADVHTVIRDLHSLKIFTSKQADVTVWSKDRDVIEFALRSLGDLMPAERAPELLICFMEQLRKKLLELDLHALTHPSFYDELKKCRQFSRVETSTDLFWWQDLWKNPELRPHQLAQGLWEDLEIRASEEMLSKNEKDLLGKYLKENPEMQGRFPIIHHAKEKLFPQLVDLPVAASSMTEENMTDLWLASKNKKASTELFSINEPKLSLKSFCHSGKLFFLLESSSMAMGNLTLIYKGKSLPHQANEFHENCSLFDYGWLSKLTGKTLLCELLCNGVPCFRKEIHI